MAITLPKTRNDWARIGAALVKDIRSTIVGALFGAIVAYVGALLATEPDKFFLLGVNKDGFGQPKALFQLRKQAEVKLTLNFHPPQFENVFVCEHKFIRSSSWKSAILTYLSDYGACFNVLQISEGIYSIYPNMNSGILMLKTSNGNTDYFCKCKSIK